MNDINNVFIVGRLTKDMELKFTSSGTPVGSMSIANNWSKKSGDKWEDEVNFFDVTLWGKLAESLSQYLTKGKQIAVSGELRQDRWEQDGQHRSRVKINASSIQLLGGGKEASAAGQEKSSAPPWQEKAAQRFPENSTAGMVAEKFDGEMFEEDDIPF